MSKLDKHIGCNIRTLRERYGETQKTLGAVVGVEHNTISYYESGKHQVPTNTLKRIASHYSVSIEELTNNLIVKVEIEESYFSWEDLAIAFDILFPSLKNEAVEENDLFEKGSRCSNKIFSAVKQLREMPAEDEFRYLIETAIEAFEEAIDEKNHPGALAETIRLLCLFFLVPYVDEEKIPQVKREIVRLNYRQIASKDLINFYRFINELEEAESKTSDYDQFVYDGKTLICDCINKLRKFPEFRSFANYYYALLFVMGIGNLKRSKERNREKGEAMMYALALEENTYAKGFMTLNR